MSNTRKIIEYKNVLSGIIKLFQQNGLGREVRPTVLDGVVDLTRQQVSAILSKTPYGPSSLMALPQIDTRDDLISYFRRLAADNGLMDKLAPKFLRESILYREHILPETNQREETKYEARRAKAVPSGRAYLGEIRDLSHLARVRKQGGLKAEDPFGGLGK